MPDVTTTQTPAPETPAISPACQVFRRPNRSSPKWTRTGAESAAPRTERISEPMAAKFPTKRAPSKLTTQARHEAQCSICSHNDREEIDRSFVHWASSVRLAEEYMVARSTLYRHAHATGLLARRQK